MTLTVNTDCDQIQIQSTELDDFIANPASYTKVEVIGKRDLSSDGIVKEFTSLSPITGTGDVVTIAGDEFINPSFFSATKFTDGIYQFQVKLTDLVDDITVDTGCVFVNCETKCSVAKTVSENQDLQLQVDYLILTETNDCQCDCEGLMKIFERVSTVINNLCKKC